MSDRNAARRTLAQVYFAGVDISKSLRPYLLSLTYTDNEEDETDDLQIKIEDRDGVWLRKWLDASVQSDIAGGGATGDTGGTGGTGYTVSAKSGLNIRSGPGTSYAKYGAYAYGTSVDVLEISGGWAKISYSGKTAYVAAEYLTASGGTESAGSSVNKSSSGGVKGLSIQAVILRENWNSDGRDSFLDCGQFELDNIQASGPPSTVTIKATSLPYSSTIRQMKKSKAWEGYYLSGIANEMASKAGMAVCYESERDPYYDRVEQITEPDIIFLQRLPARLLGCVSGVLSGAAAHFFYSFMMRLTLSRSSSSVSHFSMSSRIAFSRASVTFISVISSLPFKKLVGLAPKY